MKKTVFTNMLQIKKNEASASRNRCIKNEKGKKWGGEGRIDWIFTDGNEGVPDALLLLE